MAREGNTQSNPRDAGRSDLASPELQLHQGQAEQARLEDELRQKTHLLSLSREAIIIVNTQGTIVSWNKGAEYLYGWSEKDALGKTPTELLKTELPRPIAQIENILRKEGHWDYELKQTTRDGKQVIVASRWSLLRDASSQPIGRVQLNMDITRRRRAEQELRIVSGRMLNLRDEEQRRLARDLHDSVGQLLALAKMNLSAAGRQLTDMNPVASKLFTESCGLIEQSLSEVRTVSYLLHPPLLEELGLSSVLAWYVSGFAQRSEIKVDLEVPEKLGRFSKEMETAVFRIVQECLTNVHRHSNSTSARITVSRLHGQLRLKVEDEGRGIVPPKSDGASAARTIPGVGISGIRERVRQLGGQIQIRSGDWGTAVEVQLPLDENETRSGVHAQPQATAS